MLTYTLAQAKAFTASAARDELRRDREHEARTAMAVRMAMGLEHPAWTKYINELTT
ncbi:hypothetical protein [Xanthomonas theicola]|uniref:hypothetical protein n=1 Tax=Xanthomonas theicola TaxID=56464 RepID=UPI001304B47B|nr:hypothetical protein [Xanthomonas theicola]QNH23486.1 hypothetical protein G4Q83_08575 [Xanthomonas theicola]